MNEMGRCPRSWARAAEMALGSDLRWGYGSGHHRLRPGPVESESSEAQCWVQSFIDLSHCNNTNNNYCNNSWTNMEPDAKMEQERLREKMSEGDRAIREILHLLEDSSKMNEDDGSSSTRTLLHHAILCASFLCLVLFLAIIVLHRKYSRLSRMSSTTPLPGTGSSQQPMDTVIVISEERRIETEMTCDHRIQDSTSV